MDQNMTVARSSRVARGDRRCGRSPSLLPAARAFPSHDATPRQLPPPPASIPPNFQPAYLGLAPSRVGSGSGAVAAVDSAAPFARPARRVPAATSRSTPTPRFASSFTYALPAARRTMGQRAAETVVLPTPPRAVCSGVNAALAAWRSRGCPSVKSFPAGILRHRLAINATATTRPRRSVSFLIPAPSIQVDSASPASPIHGGSNRHAAASSAGRGSRRDMTSVQPSTARLDWEITAVPPPSTPRLHEESHRPGSPAAHGDPPPRSSPATAALFRLPPPPASFPDSFKPASSGVVAAPSSSRSGAAPRSMIFGSLSFVVAQGDSPSPEAARVHLGTTALSLRPGGGARLPPPSALIPQGFTPAFLGWGSVDGAVRARVEVAGDSMPGEEGAEWTLVLSKQEKREQRGYGRRDGHPVARRSTSSPRPRHFHQSRHPPRSPARSTNLHRKFQKLRPCHRCLARDHLVAVCRDPVKCLECRRSGHRRRDCQAQAWAACSGSASTPPPHPAQASPARASSPASSATKKLSTASSAPTSSKLGGTAYLGALETRTTEDIVSISMTPIPHQHPSAPARAPPAPVRHSRGTPTSPTSTPSTCAPSATRAPAAPARHSRHSRGAPTSSTCSDFALGIRERACERSPHRHGGGSNRHERYQASPPVASRVRQTSPHRQRAAPVSTLRSFADVLMACPEMDMCYSTSTWVVLASERCYKMGVDGALSAENERDGLGPVPSEPIDAAATRSDKGVMDETAGLLARLDMEQGNEPPHEGRQSPSSPCHDHVTCTLVGSTASSVLDATGHGSGVGGTSANLPVLSGTDNDGLVPEGGELLQFISSTAAPVNLLLTGHVPVLISPGDELCDGGFASDDDEDEVVDGKMEQLLPGHTELDQVELLLDGEEVAYEDGLDDDGDLERREFQLVADVIDTDAEAATIGNLFAADIDDAPSSGIAIRSVADLFSLPDVPLLPTPTPPMPRALAALPDPERRSSRLAAKPQLTAVGKAQHVLHKKMGLDFGDMSLVEATKEFANTCKKAPLSDSAINGLRTLLRLNLPSMTATDEALIGLAGPGGSDFPPPTALDVSA